MRGSFKIAVALCLLASSALAGILYQHRGISGSSLYPPQENLSFWGTGIDGTNVTSSVGSGAYVAGSNCKEFDGVGDFLTVNDTSLGNLVVNTTTDFYLEFTVNLDALDVFDCIAGNFSTSVNGWRIDCSSSGYMSFYCYDGNGYACATPISSGMHTYKLERVSGSYEWYTDGVPSTSADTLSAANFSHNCTRGVQIGRRNSSPYADFDIAYFKCVYGGSTQFEYRFASGEGLTEYDVSGNGNHGTYTTADASAMAVTDNAATPWNLINGFDLWTNGVLDLRVPLLSDGTSIKGSGDTISGYEWQSKWAGGHLHNNAESTLQVGSDNYSYADMIAMGPTTNGVIDNLLVYTNAPSSTAALDIWCEINSGVYTNTAP